MHTANTIDAPGIVLPRHFHSKNTLLVLVFTEYCAHIVTNCISAYVTKFANWITHMVACEILKFLCLHT